MSMTTINKQDREMAREMGVQAVVVAGLRGEAPEGCADLKGWMRERLGLGAEKQSGRAAEQDSEQQSSRAAEQQGCGPEVLTAETLTAEAVKPEVVSLRILQRFENPIWVRCQYVEGRTTVAVNVRVRTNRRLGPGMLLPCVKEPDGKTWRCVHAQFGWPVTPKA